jgi:erythromycin esterase
LYTQEVLDMVMWMREFNQSGKGHIEFWGFDMRKPGAALANVSKFLDAADPEYSTTAYKGLSAALLQLTRHKPPKIPVSG